MAMGFPGGLREFVWETSVILAQAREERGPETVNRGKGGSPELATLERYAGRHSMRAPVGRPSAVRFFAKSALWLKPCAF